MEVRHKLLLSLVHTVSCVLDGKDGKEITYLFFHQFSLSSAETQPMI